MHSRPAYLITRRILNAISSHEIRPYTKDPQDLCALISEAQGILAAELALQILDIADEELARAGLVA